MQKEQRTSETKTEAAVDRVITPIRDSSIRGNIHKAFVNARRKLHVLEDFNGVKSRSELIAKETVEYVNSITGKDYKVPKIVIDVKKRSQAVGYFDYSTPDTLFINPYLSPGELRTTIAHETIHYVRARSGTKNHHGKLSTAIFLVSIDEGVAEFVSECMNIRNATKEEGVLLRFMSEKYDVLNHALALYGALDADLKSNLLESENLGKYIDKVAALFGIRKKYVIGASAMTILLSANDFDMKCTVAEILTSSDSEIMFKVLDIVSKDNNGDLEKRLNNLQNFRDALLFQEVGLFVENAKTVALDKKLWPSVSELEPASETIAIYKESHRKE